MEFTESRIEFVTNFVRDLMKGREWAYYCGNWRKADFINNDCVPLLSELANHPERFKLKPEPRIVQLWEFYRPGGLWVPSDWTIVGSSEHYLLEANALYRKVGKPFPEDVE